MVIGTVIPGQQCVGLLRFNYDERAGARARSSRHRSDMRLITAMGLHSAEPLLTKNLPRV